jgi:hypothetical protein
MDWPCSNAKGSNMSVKLNDTQLVLLSAASQRTDGYLAPPTGPRLASAKKAAAKLLAEGLVREVRARKDAPVWRRDDASDQAFALKLTAAGLKAIAVDPGNDAEQGEGAPCEALPAASDIAEPDSLREADEEGSSPRIPRAGTKISEVVGILGREAGATLEEIVAATGWLPHTARAALTGLRKRGYSLVSGRSDRVRGTVYRIAPLSTSDGAAVTIASDALRPQGAPDAGRRRKAGPATGDRRQAS